MEKEAEKFLQAEETAVKLVETLRKLLTEATSYQTATKELDTVRQRLLNLIESTEKVANGSYEVIKILMEIGAPEILSRITKVENKVSEESAKISKGIESLEKETKEMIAKVENKVSKESLMISKGIESLEKETTEMIAKMENKVSEESAKHLKGMEKIKTLIIITLTSSILAIIVGILALLR